VRSARNLYSEARLGMQKHMDTDHRPKSSEKPQMTSGRNLAFDDQGSGFCCVFIHGLGEGRYVWLETVRRWQGRSIAVDLPGHGDSEWLPSGEYTVEHDADMARTLIDHVVDEPFVLVGHSRGAAVAARIAASKPCKLVGLILVDHNPSPSPLCSSFVSAEFEQMNQEFSSIDAVASWMAEQRPIAARETIMALAPLVVRRSPAGGEIAKRDPAILAARRSDRSSEALYKLLAVIDVPILIVRGQISSFLPAQVARDTAAAARHGSVATVPMAGHSVMIDNPEGFIEAIAPFVATTIAQGVSTDKAVALGLRQG
jgi:pimeloyl-ACP methyl ester carboxylesterase